MKLGTHLEIVWMLVQPVDPEFECQRYWKGMINEEDFKRRDIDGFQSERDFLRLTKSCIE